MSAKVAHIEGQPERLVTRSSAASRCLAELEAHATQHSSLLLSGEAGTGRTTLASYVLDLAKSNPSRRTIIDGRTPNAPERLRALLDPAKLRATRAVLIDHATEGLAGDVRYLLDVARDTSCRIVLIADHRDDLHLPTDLPRVRVPALRDRRPDIPQLAHQLARRSCAAQHHRRVGFTSAAMDVLEAYRWPDNIRELADVIDRAVSLRDDLDCIDVEDLPRRLSREPAAPDEDVSLEAAKRRHVERVLGLHRGNVRATATTLGVGRNTLARWLAGWTDA